MKRASWNIVVDLSVMVSSALMISTGLIVRYILPPGSGRAEMLGHGRRHQTILTYLGLGRHDWGEIHFWCSIAFLLLILLHLILHWNWIKSALWEHSWRRRGALIAAAIVFLTAITLPLLGERVEMTKDEYLGSAESER